MFFNISGFPLKYLEDIKKEGREKIGKVRGKNDKCDKTGKNIIAKTRFG